MHTTFLRQVIRQNHCNISFESQFDVYINKTQDWVRKHHDKIIKKINIILYNFR